MAKRMTRTTTKRGTGSVGRGTAGTRRAVGAGTVKRSPRSYAELGRLGGEAVKRSRGRAFFAEIGRKGGKIGGEARKRQLMGG